jgi:hypothetical protein
MKYVRTLGLVLAIAGCGPSDLLVTDGGTGTTANIQLGVPTYVTVATGESTTINVSITAFDVPSPTLTVSTSPLPDGVTCQPVVVTVTSTMQAKLTFVASAGAAISELPIAVRVSFNGKIVGSSPVLLDVSAVVGSLDPTFGIGGVLALPNTADEPTAIRVVDDGTIVVAGTGTSGLFIERFAPWDMPGAPFVAGGSSVTSGAAPAIASNGRVAFDVQNNSNNESITEFSVTNAIILTKQVLPATALAWDGIDLYVATTGDLRRFDPTGDSVLASGMTIASLEPIAPGTVLAMGVNGSASAVLETFTVAGSTFDPSTPIEVSTGKMHALNTVTTSQGTLVGLAGSDGVAVLRLDSQNNTLATYSLGTPWASANKVVALPNGDPIVLGVTQIQTGTKSLDTNAAYVFGFEAPFGVLGHTYILGASTVTAGAIDASGQYLYVTGWTNNGGQFHGWVARLRLTSTP